MEPVLNIRPATWKDSYRMSTLKLMTQSVDSLTTWRDRISTSRLLNAPLQLTTSIFCEDRCWETTASLLWLQRQRSVLSTRNLSLRLKILRLKLHSSPQFPRTSRTLQTSKSLYSAPERSPSTSRQPFLKRTQSVMESVLSVSKKLHHSLWVT